MKDIVGWGRRDIMPGIFYGIFQQKQREGKRNEGRKERRIDKARVFLIRLNLDDRLCEVHHIILLVCILKFFIKNVFNKKLNQCLAHMVY